jgi:hypothetical protein
MKSAVKLIDIDRVLRRDINFDKDQKAAAKYCLTTPGVGGIATHYGLDGPESNPVGGRDFIHQFIPNLGPTHLPVQLGTGSLSGG